MILPSKHLSWDRALLSIGATILQHIHYPITVSALWEELPHQANAQKAPSALRYDAFVLALDMLFLINVIELREGTIFRRVS